MANIKKPSLVPLIMLAAVVFFAFVGTAGYFWVKSLSVEQIIGSSVVRNIVEQNLGEDGRELFDALPVFLGYSRPYTYLLLFQNNTELRPGGGFIGSYAVLRADQGHLDVLVVEGTETLDAQAPDSWQVEPPEPIKEHLGLSTWYFRDSNWSPDFLANAQRALRFYQGEGGESAGEIDAVVAITPTVLEKMLALTGPVTIQGIEFTADNVVEVLEYEVEYGYYDKDINFSERKQIMEPLTLALLDKLKANIFTEWQKYIQVFKVLADEKHILVYSTDDNIEKIINKNEWSGDVKQVEDDFLMWVDANLAALKTDHAMKRELSYSIKPHESGRYLATASMRYIHQGEFDWRTTRYRTYARIYVPQGSELVWVEVSIKEDRSDEPDEVDSGAELDKSWFGTFISIEPGQQNSLTFRYLLPERLSQKIAEGQYSLYLQKQSGTIAHGLSVDLGFANNILKADPEENRGGVNNAIYSLDWDLSRDRQIFIELE